MTYLSFIKRKQIRAELENLGPKNNIMSEFSYIDKYLKPLAGESGLDLSDDIALLAQDKNYACSSDIIVEGTHFLENTEPRKIAQKLLAVNLSDLAAKALTPEHYMLNLSLNDFSEGWFKEFCVGLKIMQDQYNFKLIGGDTTKTSGNIVVSATIFGSYQDNFIPRNNCQDGDLIWHSGFIGSAYLGLKLCQGKLTAKKTAQDKLCRNYELPEPRLALQNILLNYAHSALDISDGLLQDLEHLLKFNNFGANIDLAKISVALETKAICQEHDINLAELLTAGDDYEILFTSKAEHQADILNAAKQLSFPVSLIGKVNNNGKLSFTNAPDSFSIPDNLGYKHH